MPIKLANIDLVQEGTGETGARWKMLERGRMVEQFLFQTSLHAQSLSSVLLFLAAHDSTIWVRVSPSQLHLPLSFPGGEAKLGLFHADRFPVSRTELSPTSALPAHWELKIQAKAKHFKGKTKQKHSLRHQGTPLKSLERQRLLQRRAAKDS